MLSGPVLEMVKSVEFWPDSPLHRYGWFRYCHNIGLFHYEWLVK